MENNDSTDVSIVDIGMPFVSMVIFMVKATVAFIPAAFILALIGALLMGLISGIGQ